MITLYIDTTSNYLYTALLKEKEVLSSIIEKLDRDLSSLAMPKIEKMFLENSLTVDNVTQIVVVNGPGSFTGIRIGVTIAKVMAWSKNIPIKTISSLEAMAISNINKGKIIVPLIDARRGFVYSAIYNEVGEPILNDSYISLDVLKEKLSSLSKEYIVISNDKVLIDGVENITYIPDFSQIVSFFEKRKNVNPHIVEPTYLKLTEAEENRLNANKEN